MPQPQRESWRSEAELFRLLADNVQDCAIFVVDPQGRVQSWNSGAERLLGYREDEILGQSAEVFFTPEDLASGVAQREMQESLEGGRGNDDRWYVRKEGSRFWAGSVMTPLWDDDRQLRGFAKIIRDRTEWKVREERERLPFAFLVENSERRMADAELARLTAASEQQRRIYETALSSTADFNYIFDLQGRFVYVNRALLDLWGKALHEAVGKNFFELDYPHDLAARLQRQIQQVIDTRQPVRDETPYTSAVGERQYEYIFVPVLGENGEVEAVAGSTRDITERKRAEEALRESEQRFRQLADAMPQIVWSARPDGTIDYLNRRWTEFTGLPGTVGNDGWGQILHPADVLPASERWAASLASGARFEMEVRLLDRHQQNYRWHLIRTVAVVDEAGRVARWFGTSTDIDEQKRAEQSSRYLAEASAALAGVVDYESTLQKIVNLAVPFFADWSTVDVASGGGLRRLAVAHQDPEKVQLAHELVRQYPPDPQAKSGIGAAFRTGQPEIVGQITDELLVQGAQDERHLRLLRSLGLKSYICVPLIVSGNSLGVLTFVTAESGRRYCDADLAQAKDLAQRAAVAIENTQLYQTLRENDRRKDEFLATLAHELRNPLAPLRNALQVLDLGHVDADTVQQVREIMGRQVDHLVRLVDDLLDVSRVMRGKIELRKERTDLASVVARAIETAQPLIELQQHTLDISLPSEPLLLDADPVRLAQVVSNLLTNAAKYTEAHGRIGLKGHREANEAVLRVRDNGIGIAPDMLPHVFELFVQADHASTKAQGGLGVGLTLVKNLVGMHHGTVQVHSGGLGQGCEFVVRLPLLHQAHQPRMEGGGGEQWHERTPSGHRLLVVDDNKDAAESLAMLLRLQGHEVQVAHDGPTALEVAVALQPHVVFLDIGMPKMDGFEVARRLRRMPGPDNFVLVALTGWGQQEDRRRTAEAGFDHHLVKPPDRKALERVLAGLKRPKDE